MKTNRMLVVLLVALTGFAACGKNRHKKNHDEVPASQPESETPKEDGKKVAEKSSEKAKETETKAAEKTPEQLQKEFDSALKVVVDGFSNAKDAALLIQQLYNDGMLKVLKTPADVDNMASDAELTGYFEATYGDNASQAKALLKTMRAAPTYSSIAINWFLFFILGV